MKTAAQGLTFGNASHLPAAEALVPLIGDWHNHMLLMTQNEPGRQGTSSVARIPGIPEAVIRIQNSGRNTAADALEAFARQGIRHLQLLEDSGIYIPPQRLFVGPSVYRDDDDVYLYSTTDYLWGRELTTLQVDQVHARPTIQGLAQYFGKVLQHEQLVLWDKAYAHQHTVLNSGQVALHDTGLDFLSSRKSNGRSASPRIREAAKVLQEWGIAAGLAEQPQALRQLLRATAPWPLRIFR